MKPTTEEIKRANLWLDERMAGYKKDGYFVVMPVALRETIQATRLRDWPTVFRIINRAPKIPR
jgi:hypothetical protein